MNYIRIKATWSQMDDGVRLHLGTMLVARVYYAGVIELSIQYGDRIPQKSFDDAVDECKGRVMNLIDKLSPAIVIEWPDDPKEIENE